MPKLNRRQRTASKRAAPKAPRRDHAAIARKGWETRASRKVERIAADIARAEAAVAVKQPAIGTIRVEPDTKTALEAAAFNAERDKLMRSARDTGFDFGLGQRVLIVRTDTPGEVTGRADYLDSPITEYRVRWQQPDGRYTETWVVDVGLSNEL